MARTTRIVIAACVGAASVVGVWKVGALYGATHERAGESAGASVRTALVRSGPMSSSVTNIGTVQALNTVLIRARVDGVIDRVLFKEGQLVSRGDVLIMLDPLPFEAQLRSAQAQLAKDDALLANARIDLRRYEGLVEADSISTQTRDTARSLVSQLVAAVATDAAQVDLARLSLSYTTIKSPIDGRVGARLIDAGNVVHTTDTNGLVMITQVRPIAVDFAVPQERLNDLRASQRRGPVPVAVLNDSGEPTDLQGEITLIDNQIDVTTGTIRCKAQFSNADDALWPGQFVTVRVVLKTVADAIVIPSKAVQAGATGPYVYVVTPSRRASARSVHVASVDGDRTMIGSGLRAGETVVTEGQFRLEPDALVHVEPAEPTESTTPTKSPQADAP